MEQAKLAQEIISSGGISFAEAARRLPSFRMGRPVSPSCIWRWSRKGVRLPEGRVIRLEALRVSGRWLTSEGALTRFLLAQQPTVNQETEPVKSSAKREKIKQKAVAELERLGL